MESTSSDNISIFNSTTIGRLWYIITGVIIANLAPLSIYIPSLHFSDLWSLITMVPAVIICDVYTLPLVLIDLKLHLFHGLLFVGEDALKFPTFLGFALAIPFWAIIGGLIGFLTFRHVIKRGRGPGSRFQVVYRTFGSVVLTFIATLIVLIVTRVAINMMS